MQWLANEAGHVFELQKQLVDNVGELDLAQHALEGKEAP